MLYKRLEYLENQNSLTKEEKIELNQLKEEVE